MMRTQEADQTPPRHLSNGDEAARKVPKGGWITSSFLLGSIFGISVSLTGALANLIVYLIKEYNVKSIDAAQIGNIVSGCTSLAPVAGAIVADAFFGCYPVIVFSAIVSFLSSILFTLSAAIKSLRPPHCAFGSSTCESSSAGQIAFLYLAVALLSVGTAGTRFNVLSMGASQFDKVENQNIFFNWYFIVIYAAGIIGSTVFVFIEDSISWTLGFGLSAAINAISIVVLLLGAKYYRKPAAQGSPFTGLARVVVAAANKWNVEVPQENPNYYHGEGGSGNDKTNLDFAPTQSLRFLNRAALICHGEISSDGSLAKPWRLCTVQQVQDLKALVSIFPLWSSSIFLSVSIGIQYSLTVLQALTMDRSVGPRFSIPAGSISVSSLAATMLALSLLDRLVLPLWRRLTRHTPTPLQRIGLGHALNIAAMAASALVERKRAGVVHAHHAEGQAGWEVPMTALWLVVPMVVTGVGEALHFPGQVALYYEEFPRSLRNTSAGMMSVLIGLGFYLSTAMVDLVRRNTGWLPDNINAAKMENVYWLVTVLTVVNFGYYVVCAMLFKHQNGGHEEGDDNIDQGH
ncbi:protein NRT1/ PTR FAMILY 2.7-like [Canna indica]|uniref:Protein NRT1/ PTR FAMILY 2.7-like n=1 Tax=Canna indica TaxID=4628 RepID=A0AAQ3QA22_9LILI|nr:protein NRT1/ PTR FAMILY 2.7-like [Canna indica]